MYKYTYANLPIEYLRTKFSLWTNEDNENYYIYLFDNEKDLLDYLERFYVTTAVAMNVLLENELDCIIKDDTEYVIIKDFIRRANKVLERIDIPEWQVFEEIKINKVIKHTHFEMKVKDIIDQFETLYKLYSHDVTVLNKLLQNIKVKIDYCKYTDSVYEEFIKVTEDNMYIFIDIQIVNNYFGCNMFKCNTMKSNLEIIFLLAQPNNNSANKLCKRLMNTRMIGKVYHLKELLKDR